MAIQIDLDKGSKKIKDIDEKNRKLALKGTKIALAGIISIIVIAAAVNAVDAANKISDISGKYAEAQSEFDAMKAQAAANEAEAASKVDDDNSKPAMTDKDMYSARADGQRVCELLEQAYREGGLIVPEDAAEFSRLTGTSDALWFGSGMNPADSPIKWEFLTWYDSTDGHKYKTAWGCYAPDSNGTLAYLLCAQYGNYDGEAGRFSLEGSYITTFGEMYLDNGYIENEGPSPSSSEIIDIAGQLSGDGADQGESMNDPDILFPAANAHGGGTGSGGGQETSDNGQGGATSNPSRVPDLPGSDVPTIGLY